MEPPRLPPTFWNDPVEDDPYALHIDVGAALDEIEPHTLEVQAAIEEMYTKLPTETRILEGTVLEPYSISLETLENEYSQPKRTEEEWKTAWLNGSWTNTRIPTSELVSNTSSSSAEPSTQVSDTPPFGSRCPRPLNGFLQGLLGGDGSETDATDESSECTVPMTSEPMLGTPNELK